MSNNIVNGSLVLAFALVGTSCVQGVGDPSGDDAVIGFSDDSELAIADGSEDASAQSLIVGGDVIRHDGIQNLVIAKNLSFTPNGQGGNCDLWNKNGGSAWVPLDSRNNCSTASMNGRTYSWTVFSDTDAFTLQFESYWVKIDGVWRYIPANVYTRIHDNQNAHCYRESDGVNCYVSLG